MTAKFLAKAGAALCGLCLSFFAGVGNATQIHFSWDAQPIYPVGVTYDFQVTGWCDLTGLTTTEATCDITNGTEVAFHAQVRAVPPTGYQCGEPPQDCVASDWVTLDINTITPSKAIGASHGTIAPNSVQQVVSGSQKTFTLSVDSGYSAFVDGTCGGNLAGFDFTTSNVINSCTVVANFIPSSCIAVSSGGSAYSSSMTQQTGTFTYKFSAVTAGTDHDLLIGHTDGAWTSNASFATNVRFSTSGLIDVLDGTVYTSITTYPYVANAQYNVRTLVNVPANTYSVWVAPDGGSETQLANNYAFRAGSTIVAPAMASIGTLDYKDTTSANSLTSTVSNVSVGDLVFLAVQREAFSAITGVSATGFGAFTQLASGSESSGFGYAIYGGTATASATSRDITASFSTSASWGAMYAIRYTPGTGIVSFTPMDVSKAPTSGSGLVAPDTVRGSGAADLIVTSGKQALIIASGTDWNNYNAHTGANGFTKRVDSTTFITTQWFYDSVKSSGTYGGTTSGGKFGDSDTSDQYMGAMVALELNSAVIGPFSKLNNLSFVSSAGSTLGAYVCPIGISSSGPPSVPTNYHLTRYQQQR